MRPSPDFERTSICPLMQNTGKCDRPGCRYAHSQDELRVDPGLLKSKMCSFFMSGVCVVGKACRFAHSQQELEEAKILMQQANIVEQPQLMPVVEDQQQESSSSPKEDSPVAATANPMKVVIDAPWADDLQEVPEGKDVCLVKPQQPESKGGGVESIPKQARRSRARRILVDTSADLADLEADSERLGPVAIAVQTTKTEKGALVVADSSGRMDLASRRRQPVVVLDIEDSLDVCQGCDKFVQHHSSVNEIGYLVEIKRRKGKLQRFGASKRSSSCSAPVQTPCSGTGRKERATTDAPPPTNWCHRGYGVRCNFPAPPCAICKGHSNSGGQKCAACKSGVRVIQQNTFLTVTDDTEDELREVPFRRTKSL